MFNAAAPTDTYTLSLHDALPISLEIARRSDRGLLSEAMRTQWSVHPVALAQTVVPVALPDVPLEPAQRRGVFESTDFMPSDRKSTRLNSSHVAISYAVFCLKKKI